MALRLFRVAGPLFGSLRREAKWRPGTYLTDGKRLFVMITPLTPPAIDGLAELEDCNTGYRLLYTARELWALWLEPLRSGRGPARTHRRDPFAARAMQHSQPAG